MNRPILKTIIKRMGELRKFIQVLIGPRQVGKTTLALEAAKLSGFDFHYASADSATLQDSHWLKMQWDIGRHKAAENKALLVVDEVQKIPNWFNLVKALWDEDTKSEIKLVVILLGSSPWLMQKGLTESLAGRFEILPIAHWSFSEMREAFDFTLSDYIFFGGYPGAAHLAKDDDENRWFTYINDALIETTISRDILLMTQVNKPALLRRLFQLGCTYSGQILSYTKMLGQLQDAGNTTTVSHYLELLSGAWALTGLEKFAMQPVRSRASSPKFQVFNTALMSAQRGYSFSEAQNDKEYWGRLVESCVGAHLLAAARSAKFELFYWRDGNYEVDFVARMKDKIVAIEVKSGAKKEVLSGLSVFEKQFKPHRCLEIGQHGLPLEEFLLTPIEDWFA